MNFKHFIALNIADALTTWYALTHLNLFEGNPIIAWLINAFGFIIGLIVFKLILIGVLYYILLKIPSNVKIEPFHWDGKQAGINLICFMFIIIVGNNIYMLLTAL